VAGHQVFLASTLQWCKPKLPENTVTQITDSQVLEVLSLIEHEAEQLWEYATNAGQDMSYDQAISFAFLRVRKDLLNN
jgi:hypothetical protein